MLKTGWLSALFGGLLIIWVGLFFFLTYMINVAASAEIALRQGTLSARGGVYGRDIPLSEVDVAGAFRLDLGDGGPKALRWRTNGVGPARAGGRLVPAGRRGKRPCLCHGQVPGGLCAHLSGLRPGGQPGDPTVF